MKKINGFQIISLSLKGFKCFADEKKFDFGPLTYVSGDNYKGKSSIADAIAFAFTGTPFFGDRGLDRLQNDKTTEMEVSVQLLDDSGQKHELVRTRKRDITAISYDGYMVRQTDLTEAFGEKDLFLSMFNPFYFIKTLGADKRDMLQKMLPFIEHNKILERLDEGTRALLENEKLMSPETYIKNRRDEIRENEESVVYLQGQDDLLDTQKKNAAKALVEIEKEMQQAETEIADLETLLNESCSEKEIAERLTELWMRKDELLRDKPTDQECRQLTKAIYDMKLELEQRKTQVFASPHKDDIKEKEMALKYLYGDHKKITDLLKVLKPGFHCPTCLQTINENSFEAAKNEVEKEITECLQLGKKAKQELTLMQSEEKRLADNFEKALAQVVEGIEKRINDAQEQLNMAMIDKDAADIAYEKSLEELNRQIQHEEQSGEYGNLSPEQIMTLTDIRKTQDGLIVKKAMLVETINQVDMADKIKQTESEIKHLKMLVNAAVTYIGKKNELLFSGFNLNRVKIVLYEIVKSTGEIKDAFLFTYEGRDYTRLSLSEKVKAGLEVTELIKTLSGRCYPTFIDNCESVTSIDNVKPSGQIIVSHVVKKQALSVTYKPVQADSAERAA